MKHTLWFIPAFLVFLGILLLSTILTFPMQVEGVKFLDKWEHTFAYAVLVISFLVAFQKNGLLQPKNWLLLLVGCALYGILLEVAQFVFFPNRFFEWFDALANVLGALIGSLIYKLLGYGKG